MANDIQLKRSSVAGKTPDAANVLIGEPVVNLTDKILYTKDVGGNVIIIGAGTTSNIAEGTNQYFTNARVYSNVTQLGYATTSYVDAATANAGGGANVVLGVLVQDSYTANGTGTTYVLTNATSNANSIIVFVDSVLQSPVTNYTVSGTTLSFTSAPDISANIDVRYFAQDEFDISIGMLNNVSNTSPLVGQALIWSGTNWSPSNVSTSANVVSVNGKTGVVTLSTADIDEGTNLYFTNARVYSNVTQLGYITSSALTGYATNTQLGVYATNTQLATYATNAQLASYATNSQLALYATNAQLLSYATTANLALKANIVDLTTANVTEVNNLYFTNARVYSNVTQLGYLTSTSLSGYATNSQLATYATNAQLAFYATTANSLAQFASTTSAQLAGVISDETGSGSLVFATAPTLVTPTLGLATGTSVMLSANIGAAAGNVSGDFTAGTLQTTGNVNASSLRVTTASSLGTVQSGTWNGSSISTTYTDAKVTSVNGQTGAATGFATTANTLAQFATTTSAQLLGIISDETGSGSLVFATTPTLVTPILGLATGTSVMLSANIGAAAGNVSGNFTAGNFQTSGAVTSVSMTATANINADRFISSNNGNSENYRVGDDAWIGDYNTANAIKIKGNQDATQAYISFGSSDGATLGRSGLGALTYTAGFAAANVVTTGNISAGNAVITNSLTAGTLQTTGNVNASSLRVTTASSLGTVQSGTWNGSSISTTYTDAKVTSVSNTAPISISTTTGAVTVGMLSSGVTPATYGNATNIPVFTVDTFGRVTSASNVAISSTGSATIQFSDGAPATPTGNTLWWQSNTGILKVYYTDADSAQWVDAVPATPSSLASLSDDTATNDTYYPLLATATSGSLTSAKVSSTKLKYNPSTGNVAATTFTGSLVAPGGTASTSTTTGVVILTGGLGLSGNVYAGGVVSGLDLLSTSDKRLKKNIKTIKTPLNTVQELRGVTFQWKKSGKDSIGVIAQEVEEIIPQVVETDSNGNKTVSYGSMVGLLIEAIKEQQEQINELKRIINGD